MHTMRLLLSTYTTINRKDPHLESNTLQLCMWFLTFWKIVSAASSWKMQTLNSFKTSIKTWHFESILLDKIYHKKANGILPRAWTINISRSTLHKVSPTWNLKSCEFPKQNKFQYACEGWYRSASLYEPSMLFLKDCTFITTHTELPLPAHRTQHLTSHTVKSDHSLMALRKEPISFAQLELICRRH
jgi:hypothetical protein